MGIVMGSGEGMTKSALLAHSDDDQMCREVYNTHECCTEPNEKGGKAKIREGEAEVNDR